MAERPLSTATAVAVCSTIKAMEMDFRRVPGTTITNTVTGETIYTPPVGETHIRNLLANWEQYLHAEDDIDPLIKMAVAHCQFEAIHPFIDGNGRTGRVLNILYLIHAGLLHLPILYLSRFIMQYRADYYRLLTDVTRKENWQEWGVYMLRAVEETARWTTEKIAAVRELIVDTTEYVKTQLPEIYTRELVDLIFQMPYCRIQNLVDADIAQRQTANFSNVVALITDSCGCAAKIASSGVLPGAPRPSCGKPATPAMTVRASSIMLITRFHPP